LFFAAKYAPLLFPHKKNLIIVCIASGLLILFGVVTSFYFDITEKIRIVTVVGFHLSTLVINVVESWAEKVAIDYNMPEYFMWEITARAGI
jgi:ABC-type bacteriocin/lantibiotic exporter with double-glycine peptidase domain